MNIASKLSISAFALAALLTTAAFAQEAGGQAPDQMMQDQTTMPGNMMNGDMTGMQGMMQMMQQMMQQMWQFQWQSGVQQASGSTAAQPASGVPATQTTGSGSQDPAQLSKHLPQIPADQFEKLVGQPPNHNWQQGWGYGMGHSSGLRQF